MRLAILLLLFGITVGCAAAKTSSLPPPSPVVETAPSLCIFIGTLVESPYIGDSQRFAFAVTTVLQGRVAYRVERPLFRTNTFELPRRLLHLPLSLPLNEDYIVAFYPEDSSRAADYIEYHGLVSVYRLAEDSAERRARHAYSRISQMDSNREEIQALQRMPKMESMDAASLASTVGIIKDAARANKLSLEDVLYVFGRPDGLEPTSSLFAGKCTMRYLVRSLTVRTAGMGFPPSSNVQCPTVVVTAQDGVVVDVRQESYSELYIGLLFQQAQRCERSYEPDPTGATIADEEGAGTILSDD